jgi:hypothetical protein
LKARTIGGRAPWAGAGGSILPLEQGFDPPGEGDQILALVGERPVDAVGVECGIGVGQHVAQAGLASHTAGVFRVQNPRCTTSAADTAAEPPSGQ